MYHTHDIALIPHLYNVKWARDLNQYLSTVFFSPFQFDSDSYLPGRSLQHEYMANILPVMRKNKITKVFLVNLLEDFTPDLIKAGFVKEIYGIVHGSNFSQHEPGNSKTLQEYEKAVAGLTKKVFTASEWFSKQLPYDTTVIGLPIFSEIRKARNNTRILFSHRLTKEKNPLRLLELPTDIRDEIIVTSPFRPFSATPKKLQDVFGERFQPALSDEKHELYLNTCGFGLSLSDYDNFGMSVTEGIMSGLCYFVPRNETTCYPDYMLDELMFSSVDELAEKVRYYRIHFDEKVKIVKKQQQKLEKYMANNWLNGLLGEIFEPAKTSGNKVELKGDRYANKKLKFVKSFQSGAGSHCVDLWEINGQLVTKKVVITRSKFQKELQGLKLLKSCPFVPNLIDFDEDTNTIYMQYVGESLKKLYPRNRRPRRRYVPQIHEMVDHIQFKYGIYHNDIRYKNITKLHNKLYLIDWGKWSKENRERDSDKILRKDQINSIGNVEMV